MSRMPIVVPRPSHVECSFTNCAAPVSRVGRYGLTRGVSAPGGGCGVGSCEPAGGGSESGSVVSTLIVWIPLSLEASSALRIGTFTRM